MLVFTNTKRMADMLVDRLEKHNFESVALHGDMPQNKRERILSAYREGKHSVLIATDVAARGIDIDTISHVVNYDLPDETEAYVHRIGRTGRMGRTGVAWSLVTANDVLQLDRISSTWNLKIPSSQPPKLPQGVDRDPVRKREDWDEVSDPFGMVRIRVSVGRKEASKRELSDWLKSEAKLPDIAIGDLTQDDHSTVLEIHVEKAGATLEILKRREWDGSSLEPELLDRPAVAFKRASMLA